MIIPVPAATTALKRHRLQQPVPSLALPIIIIYSRVKYARPTRAHTIANSRVRDPTI